MSAVAFGPNLRRTRIQRGVSLEYLEETTRVPVDLWQGLEENDLSRWPRGIYARSYIRQYAEAIGIDPEAAVDEFCRSFPHGDRRSERVVREQAAIVDHRLEWTDDLVGQTVTTDRRVASKPRETPLVPFLRSGLGRIVAATADLCTVVAVALAASAVLPIGRATTLAGSAVLYHAVAMALLGCSPAAWTIDTYIQSRHPSATARGPRFLRLIARNTNR